MKNWMLSLGMAAWLASMPFAHAQNDSNAPAGEAGEAMAESADSPPPACPLQRGESGAVMLDEAGAPLYDETAVPVRDTDGEPVIGEDGEPLMQDCQVPVPACPVLTDEAGEPVLTDEGLARFDESPVALLDGAGEPVTTARGEPVTVSCRIPVFECPLMRDEAGAAIVDEDGAPVFDESPQPVTGAKGKPRLTAQGEPLMAACSISRRDCPLATDEDGNPLSDEDGNPVYDDTDLPILDSAGEPVLDREGEPLLQACAIPGTDTGPSEGADPNAQEEARDPSVFDPIMRLINAGGPVIVILALMAVLSIGVALVKLVQFTWLGVGRSGFVSNMVERLRRGDSDATIGDLDARRSPVARVMAASLRGKTNERMSDELVREETSRVAQAQLDGLERGLAFLSLIATIAPLLGLLGTVLGMIEAFQQMETVGDRVEPAVLAGGIWEALLTTAAGLTVAIPAAVFFTWFQRAVDVEAQRMEDAATQVFTAPLYDAPGETASG